jgi:site-specific DNA-cytosine methylase
MDYTTPTTHISLCAGYGGIDIGLSRVIKDLRTIAFSEIEGFACANLVAKMEAGLLDAAPIWTDVKTFPWIGFHDKVDILSGGFPCQPFSSAGNRSADEDPRHLFPHILRGIAECQPNLVFLENVEGIISAKLKGNGWRDPAGTPVLLHVLRELERVGYCATAGVFSSAEIGATHQRKRVFILAMANVYGARRARHGQFGHIHVSPRWEAQEGCSSSRRMDDQQWNSSRPKPPGRFQWWWEPARALARIVNGHGRLQRSIGVDDSGGDESRRLSGLGQEAHSETGQTDSSTHNHPRRPDVQMGTIESSLGRDIDGSSGGMDYAKLCKAVDNRTDELRSIGNGVDPDVAAKAFITLYRRLID